MSEEQVVLLIISDEDITKYKRLDAYLADQLKDYSRSLIKRMFQEEHFKSPVKLELKKMPAAGVEIEFSPPELSDTDLVPQNIPLEILFEDSHLIIINKPAGLVVHPAPGNPDGTLVNAILYHCNDLKGIGNEKRPGIVHRLDKGTSGVMVIAKDQKTHEGLVKLFSTHDIDRKYETITLGSKLPETRTLKSIIGRSPHNRLKMSTNVKHGKDAITHLKVLQYFHHFSHAEMTLETGRTHQIRVHLSELLNSPILNDHTYGRIKEERHLMTSEMKAIIKDYEHPFLHARLLGFIHPITNEKLLFEAEPPEIFQNVLSVLRKENE